MAQTDARGGEAQVARLANRGRFEEERRVVSQSRVLLAGQARVHAAKNVRHLRRRHQSCGCSRGPLRVRARLLEFDERLVRNVEELARRYPLLAGWALPIPLQRAAPPQRRARGADVVWHSQLSVKLQRGVQEPLRRKLRRRGVAQLIALSELVAQSHGGGEEQPKAVPVVNLEVESHPGHPYAVVRHRGDVVDDRVHHALHLPHHGAAAHRRHRRVEVGALEGDSTFVDVVAVIAEAQAVDSSLEQADHWRPERPYHVVAVALWLNEFLQDAIAPHLRAEIEEVVQAVFVEVLEHCPGACRDCGISVSIAVT
mmetsp:Transcript_77024/g.214194  ORF Transcript_77024/g.214194 Transcript_77024/m.214194 type:complete len:313 (-) Transcript_77024:381-1319(-)